MHKAAPHPEALHRGSARPLGVLRQLVQDVVDGIVRIVHHVHEGPRRHISRLKQGIALGVDDGVVGIHLAVDVLLHDVGCIRPLLREKALHLAVVGDPEGVGGPHPVVRLCHHRVSHLVGEVQALLQGVHHVVAGGGNPRLLIVFFHLGFIFDPGNILLLEAAGDVEVRAQPGIPLQPVLVVGLQPVDAAVLVGQKGHRPVHLVVILQVGHLVVLRQAVLQPLRQLVVGLIADSQHIDPVFL